MADLQTHEELKGIIGSTTPIEGLQAPPAQSTSQSSVTTGAPASVSPAAGQPNIGPRDSLASVRGGFNTLRDTFNTEAGESLSYTGDDRQTLLGFLGSGEGTPEGFTAANEVLNRSYEGPSELDPEAVQDFLGRSESLRGINEALQRGTGVRSLLRERTPGLSEGEARLDVGRLGRGFFADRGREVQLTQGLAEEIRAGADSARQLAETRESQAADARAKAAALVNNDASSVRDVIDQRIESTKKEEQALQDQTARFREDFRNAGPLNPQLQQIRDNLLDNPNVRESSQAARFADSMARSYPDLEGVPVAETVTNFRSGGEQVTAWRLPVFGGSGTALIDVKKSRNVRGDKVQDITGKWVRLDPNTIAQLPRMREREDRFAQAFRPGGQFEEYRSGSGEFLSDVGETQNLPNLNFAADFREGDTPTRANVATEQERLRLDRANQLIADIPRLEQVDPRQAGQVIDLAHQVLTELEQNLQSRRNNLTEEDERHLASVRQSREFFRKAKRAHRKGA